jgi:adenylyltransferase/sulfurtransferase
MAEEAEQLRKRIALAEEELKSLREDLARLDSSTTSQHPGKLWKWPLQAEEYDRYGRQLILPSIGVEG